MNWNTCQSYIQSLYTNLLFALHHVSLFCKYVVGYFYPSFEVEFRSESARMPTKGTTFSAGYDLYSDENVIVKPWERCCVKTNITIDMQNNTNIYARIAPRSGLSLKNGIHVGAGVVDSDYGGNVGVVLFNLSNEEFVVEKGNRIAQVIFEKIIHPKLLQRNYVQDTGVNENNGKRNENGFGSTGN